MRRQVAQAAARASGAGVSSSGESASTSSPAARSRAATRPWPRPGSCRASKSAAMPGAVLCGVAARRMRCAATEWKRITCGTVRAADRGSVP